MATKSYVRSKMKNKTHNTIQGKNKHKNKSMKRSNKRSNKRRRIGGEEEEEEDNQKHLQEYKKLQIKKHKQNAKAIEENKEKGVYLAPEDPNNPNALIYTPQIGITKLQNKFENNMDFVDAEKNGLTIGGGKRKHRRKTRRRISK